jgi:hypothetical protein
MFSIGQKVRVIGIFSESFPLIYTITEVVNNPDNTTAYLLDQGAGGFDAIYLEAA